MKKKRLSSRRCPQCDTRHRRMKWYGKASFGKVWQDRAGTYCGVKLKLCRNDFHGVGSWAQGVGRMKRK